MAEAAKESMRALIAFMAHRSQRRRLAACALWAGFAIAFLCLAIEARSLASTRLPKAGFRLPPGQSFRTQPPRMPEILNDLAMKHDASVAVLERALHNAARTRFWIDLAAFGACLAALAARWRFGPAQAEDEEVIAPAHAAPARSSSRAAQPEPQLALRIHEPHDGSFPGGGYGC